MTFYVNNQQHLAQLCSRDPLPASIYFPTNGVVNIGAQHIPFIYHHGLRKLYLFGKINYLSGSHVKTMFGKSLSNSTSIEKLIIGNHEVRESIVYLLHRKPLLNCLRTLTLRYPVMKNKKMLLCGKTVGFSRHLVNLTLYDINIGTQSKANIITIANILFLIYQNQKLTKL